MAQPPLIPHPKAPPADGSTPVERAIALALTIPLRPRNAGQPQAHSPLHDLEHALHKPVALLIVPPALKLAPRVRPPLPPPPQAARVRDAAM